MDNDFFIKALQKGQDIPFDLLLLADETIDAINKYIHDSQIFVYEKEQQIIGIYVLYEISKEIIEIKAIAVDKPNQGNGIGTKLLKDAINRARKMGFKSIIIGTGNGGIKQLYLYQKVGFRMYDIKKDFFLKNYPNPIYENGILLKDMIMLKIELGESKD